MCKIDDEATHKLESFIIVVDIITFTDTTCVFTKFSTEFLGMTHFSLLDFHIDKPAQIVCFLSRKFRNKLNHIMWGNIAFAKHVCVIGICRKTCTKHQLELQKHRRRLAVFTQARDQQEVRSPVQAPQDLLVRRGELEEMFESSWTQPVTRTSRMYLVTTGQTL